MGRWSVRRLGWQLEYLVSVRVYSVYYFEIFSPTTAASCIRLFAIIACEMDLDLGHFDAVQTFCSLYSCKPSIIPVLTVHV